MRERLVAELERLSAYEYAGLPEKEPLFVFRRLRIGVEVFHVITRAARAGIDYTQRGNVLVHHLVLSDIETASLGNSVTPAEIALRWDGWKSVWNEPARFFEHADRIRLESLRQTRLPAHPHSSVWQKFTGQVDNARVLRINKNILIEADGLTIQEKLQLLAEGAMRLERPQIWQATWTTRFDSGDTFARWAIAARATAAPPDFLRITISPSLSKGIDALIAQTGAHSSPGKPPDSPAKSHSANKKPAPFPIRKAPSPWKWIGIGLGIAALALAGILWLGFRESPPEWGNESAPKPPHSLPPLSTPTLAKASIPAAPAPASSSAPLQSEKPAEIPVAIKSPIQPDGTASQIERARNYLASPANFPPQAYFTHLKALKTLSGSSFEPGEVKNLLYWYRWIEPLPHTDSILLAIPWQMTEENEIFTQYVIEAESPAPLRELLSAETLQASVAPFGENFSFEQGAFVFDIRPAQDYERGASLVLRPPSRDMHSGFFLQIDLVDEKTFRLSLRRFKPQAPLWSAAENAPLRRIEGGFAIRLKSADRYFTLYCPFDHNDWVPLQLGLGKGNRAALVGKGEHAQWAEAVMPALGLLRLPPDMQFELADESRRIRSQSASIARLQPERSLIISQIEKRLAQISAIEADAQTAALREEAAELKTLHRRFKSENWVEASAPWRLNLIDASSGKIILPLINLAPSTY